MGSQLIFLPQLVVLVWWRAYTWWVVEWMQNVAWCSFIWDLHSLLIVMSCCYHCSGMSSVTKNNFIQPTLNFFWYFIEQPICFSCCLLTEEFGFEPQCVYFWQVSVPIYSDPDTSVPEKTKKPAVSKLQAKRGVYILGFCLYTCNCLLQPYYVYGSFFCDRANVIN